MIIYVVFVNPLNIENYLRVANSNRFAKNALLRRDPFLGPDVHPQTYNEVLEFLIKSLFIWELKL